VVVKTLFLVVQVERVVAVLVLVAQAQQRLAQRILAAVAGVQDKQYRAAMAVQAALVEVV